MSVVSAADAPTFDTGGAIITALASPSRGAVDTAAWQVDFDPDTPSPRHSLTHEEIFVVLEGALTATFENHEETAEAGGALIIEAGTEFSIAAKRGSAKAICVLPVGGKAVTEEGEFTPPWAE